MLVFITLIPTFSLTLCWYYYVTLFFMIFSAITSLDSIYLELFASVPPELNVFGNLPSNI